MNNHQRTNLALYARLSRRPTLSSSDRTDDAGPKHMTLLPWLKSHGYPTLLPGYRSQNFIGPFAYRSKRVSLDSSRLNPKISMTIYPAQVTHNNVPQNPRDGNISHVLPEGSLPQNIFVQGTRRMAPTRH